MCFFFVDDKTFISLKKKKKKKLEVNVTLNYFLQFTLI